VLAPSKIVFARLAQRRKPWLSAFASPQPIDLHLNPAHRSPPALIADVRVEIRTIADNRSSSLSAARPIARAAHHAIRAFGVIALSRSPADSRLNPRQ